MPRRLISQDEYLRSSYEPGGRRSLNGGSQGVIDERGRMLARHLICDTETQTIRRMKLAANRRSITTWVGIPAALLLGFVVGKMGAT